MANFYSMADAIALREGGANTIEQAAAMLGVQLSEINVANLWPMGAAGFNIPGTETIFMDFDMAVVMPQLLNAKVLTHENIHAGIWVKYLQQFNPNIPDNAAVGVYSEVITELLTRKFMSRNFGLSENAYQSYQDVIDQDEVYSELASIDLPNLIRTIFRTEGVPQNELRSNGDWIVNNVAWAMVEDDIARAGDNITDEQLEYYWENAWNFAAKTFGREITDMEIHTPGEEASKNEERWNSFKRGMEARMYHTFKINPVRRAEVFTSILTIEDITDGDDIETFSRRLNAAGYGYLVRNDAQMNEIFAFYEEFRLLDDAESNTLVESALLEIEYDNDKIDKLFEGVYPTTENEWVLFERVNIMSVLEATPFINFDLSNRQLDIVYKYYVDFYNRKNPGKAAVLNTVQTDSWRLPELIKFSVN